MTLMTQTKVTIMMITIDNQNGNQDDDHAHDNDDDLSGAHHPTVLLVPVAHITTFGPFTLFSYLLVIGKKIRIIVIT